MEISGYFYIKFQKRSAKDLVLKSFLSDECIRNKPKSRRGREL